MPSTPAAPGSDPVDLSRLRWRCRRGMRELDVVLNRWLDRHWATASPTERGAFVQLLELPDPDLWGYLVGRADPAEDEQRAVIASLRRHTA